MHIGNKRDGVNWIDFRYEKLPMFCFHCGIIRHNEANCPHHEIKFREEDDINPLGPWLRSSLSGKSILDQKNKKFSSNSLKSPSYGQYSSIPKDLMDKLAGVSSTLMILKVTKLGRMCILNFKT
ncbi:F-box/FBD/LRR-repeat protein [Trifolium medium]|uniref:F-box/FBD/LRR-repeat protein n=1 Tax=Trifolium medium TaxID=97028 RepID=A0A392M1C3_9FABA|nr:F-box/FBD/LRR-repeat protein [Trifolium medium]